MRLHALAILAAPEAQDSSRYITPPVTSLAERFAGQAFDITKQGQVIGTMTRRKLICDAWMKEK